MPAVKTGMMPPPMPGMPAPMQPMGGIPPIPPMGGAPAQNPFIPMPPAPLAGVSQPSGGQPQQVMGSNAGRRRRFGDALEGMMGGNQGIGAVPQQRPLPMPPQMMPQRQRMVAPGTPMMRTPPMGRGMARPMADGGIVRGYDAGGIVYDSQGNPTAVSSGGIGPDAYIGDPYMGQVGVVNPSAGGSVPVFQVVNPGPGSGVAIASQGMKDSGIVTDTSTGQEVVVHSGLRDLLNTFNPSTATYSIRDLDSGETGQYTVGETYDDLPADVAYSKQVQENREKLGLAGNDSSAWAMYQRGEHWSQNQPASAGGSVVDAVVDEVVSQPVTSLVGAGSGAGTGAGSAVGSGGNFGTGTYIADIVDDSQVGDIDYGQFAGDIGKFEGSQEKSALYGPKINIPQRVSQYYTDPLTGGLGTTYGSLMTAVSPIGAINLPARPVSLDINNFLSTPTYGTLYSGIAPVGDADYGFNRFEEIDRFADGGAVRHMQGGGTAKPSVKEFMDATGADFKEASQALYGSVGSNVDIRDWDAIMSADDPLRATQAATAQMYSTGAPIATEERFYDESGTYTPSNVSYGGTDVGASTGGPKLQVTGAGQIFITDSAGLPLTGLTPENAASFGITQDQIDAAIAAGGDSREGRFAGSGYQPYDAGNLLTDYSNIRGYTPSSSSVSSVVSDQMVGDVGVSSGSSESSSLYGPSINIPQKVSRFVQDPVTGEMTTTYGPEMGAISPIGGILLPARPVDLDIFDFLSTPTYGTMYSGVEGMRDGGEVPRQTMIGDQPHMLAYINPQEAALLKGLGGSGEPGPGGIPAYKWSWSTSSLNPKNWGGGGNNNSSSASTNNDDSGRGKFEDSRSALESAGYTVSDDGNAVYSSTGQVAGANWSGSGTVNSIVESNQNNSSDDNVTARVSGRSSSGSNVTSAPIGEVDFTTINPATGSQTTVATIDYGDDDDGPVIKDVTYYDDTGVNEIDAPVVNAPTTAYVDPNTGGVTIFDEPSTPAAVYTPPPPPVYTDRFGREYSSQEAADAADRAYAAQLASYGAGKEGFNRFADQASAPYISREESDRAASRIYTDSFRPELAQYDGPDIIGGLPSYNIPGVGGGDVPAVSGGVSPIEIIDPTVMPDQVDIFELPSEAGSPPVISLGEMGLRQPAGTPTSMYELDRDSYDPRGDQIVSPTGTGIGRESDLQRGLGTPSTVQDVSPAEAGYTSLSDIKDRIARAEGTADEGGYNRLLGGQEGRFGVDLTNMTVQEVLDFQKRRGPGSYAEYSQGVNEQRGMTRDDGTGVISTPAGKYQVVGSTLQSLVDQGIVDPNAKFDEGTQERIGTHLIMNDLAGGKGLSDLKSGDMTPEQFETALGKQFEGIERGLDKGAGSTSLVLAAASQAGTKAEEDRRDANVAKIQQQIGDQAEPTGVEKFFYDVVGQLGFGLGKPLADKLRGESRENRQAIIDQHVYALENGATPKTDEDGNYIGFDISTMDTFADKVLASENIMAFMPPSMAGGTFTVTQDMIDQLRASGMDAQADALTVGQTLNLPTTTNVAYQADADGDGVIDYDRFGQVYEAQSTAASEDPYGMSTEQGFITEDGKEFFVDAGGNVVEITDDVVPFEPGGGEDVAAALGVTETTTGDGEDTKNYTIGPNGEIICNQEGYVYSEAAGMCVPADDVEGGDETDAGTPTIGIGRGAPARSFEDILAGITSPAPRIAPISENIRPMQAGGMVGLNRAADNFLKALAG